MRKAYQEIFSEVHASERLRTEVLNMKNEPAARKFRISRAALIAAVLVIVLAGTALAAELLGRVRIELISPDETSTTGRGYKGEADFMSVPAESLSREALDRAAEMEDILDNWKFDSWPEAEAFLGLELLNNPRLDELPSFRHTGCTATVINRGYAEDEMALPFLIMLSASYQADGCRISQNANLKIQYPGYPQVESGWDLGRHAGETHLEEYVTPNGIEASIVATTGRSRGGLAYTRYSAYFVKNNTFCTLSTQVHDPIDHPDSVNALAILKEILDAYE